MVHNRGLVMWILNFLYIYLFSDIFYIWVMSYSLLLLLIIIDKKKQNLWL